jgi:hypothetical protein
MCKHRHKSFIPTDTNRFGLLFYRTMTAKKVNRPASAPAARSKNESSSTQPLTNTARPVNNSQSSRNHSSASSYRSSPRLPANQTARQSPPLSVSPGVKRGPQISDRSRYGGPSPKSVEDDPSSMPLFKLAQLTKKEQRVNVKKLTAFLERHGTIFDFVCNGVVLIDDNVFRRVSCEVSNAHMEISPSVT